MAKSDCGLRASSSATKMQIGMEELDLRWDYLCGKIPKKEFNKRLKEIKAKYGKKQTKIR